MRPADDVKLDVVGLPQLLLRCSLFLKASVVPPVLQTERDLSGVEADLDRAERLASC